MKKKREPDEADIRGELEEAFARWNALACGECADPGWEDGANMNLVRNHILYYYRQLEEMGACVRNLFGEIVDERPVPPQVPNNYVVRNGKPLDFERERPQIYMGKEWRISCPT